MQSHLYIDDVDDNAMMAERLRRKSVMIFILSQRFIIPTSYEVYIHNFKLNLKMSLPSIILYMHTYIFMMQLSTHIFMSL